MKIYLSGQISGIPDYNRPAFATMAKKLIAEGHSVYNPSEYQYDGDFPIRAAFSEFCKYICVDADAIWMLKGWTLSEGAIAEHALARRIGLKLLGAWR